MRLTGIFGGTFDPVHCGHLRTLIELKELLGLDEILVIPCGNPPHRASPVAPAEARLRMLQRALEGIEGVTVDDRELRSGGKSYTVETLESLRSERPSEALCLLMGSDAFTGLPDWHRWQAIPGLAHIVVARRPGSTQEVPAALEPLVAKAKGVIEDLKVAIAGKVVFCETSQLQVSSSHLRAQAAAGRTLRWLVPEQVERLIEENRWYRVSS